MLFRSRLSNRDVVWVEHRYLVCDEEEEVVEEEEEEEGEEEWGVAEAGETTT